MCYQNDIRISVSPLGTAFMEDHVKVLKLFIDTIIFCFDKDVAGEKAENRVKEMLKHDNDLRLGFMHLPGEEKDPDSFIKTYGKEAFIEALCAVKNGIGY
jgi:DNA primase